MGHARTENGEEDEGGAGGDVDYKALRKAAEGMQPFEFEIDLCV